MIDNVDDWRPMPCPGNSPRNVVKEFTVKLKIYLRLLTFREFQKCVVPFG